MHLPAIASASLSSCCPQPSVTYENGEQVMRRIMSAFNKAYVRKDVAVTYSLNLILPKEDTIEA